MAIIIKITHVNLVVTQVSTLKLLLLQVKEVIALLVLITVPPVHRLLFAYLVLLLMELNTSTLQAHVKPTAPLQDNFKTL